MTFFYDFSRKNGHKKGKLHQIANLNHLKYKKKTYKNLTC